MTTQNDANKSKNNYQSESQQAFWQAQIKTVNENNPFMRHNGIYATYLDADRAEVRAQAGDTGRNAMGSVHGGLMFIMGEMAAGLLARGNGRKYVTLDTSFRYLRSSMGEKELVTSTGRLLPDSSGSPSSIWRHTIPLTHPFSSSRISTGLVRRSKWMPSSFA